MKEESRKQKPWTDPELEARIVALVLGEASDFEREELQRLIAEWPDLAAFKEQIEDVHGLLRGVATGESAPEDDDWRLAAEKRNAVLSVIGGETEEQPAEDVVAMTLPEEHRPVRRSLFWNLTGIAAVVCVAGLLGVMAIPAWFDGDVSGSNGSLRQLALALQNYHDTYKTFESGNQPAVRGEPSLQRGKITLWNGASTWTTEDEHLRTAQPATASGFDHEKDSRSALSAIRGTLDVNGVLPSSDYLADDVQYAPVESFSGVAKGMATPRFAGEEDGPVRAPTSAVNGPGPGELSREGVAELDFTTAADGDKDQLSSSLPAASKSGNGELALPKFKADASDGNSSDFGVTIKSTIRVPDGGTVLLGGVKRLEEGRSEHGAAAESADSGAMGRYGYGEPKSGAATQELAGKESIALEDRLEAVDGKASSPELPALRVAAQDSGQQQGISRGQGRLRGGTELTMPGDPSEPGQPVAAGEVLGRVVAGGIVVDTSGNEQAGQAENSNATAEEAGEVAESESEVRRKAEDLAALLPRPTTEPQFSRADVASTTEFSITNGREEETLLESRIETGDDGIAHYDASGLGTKPEMSFQAPESTGGVATRPSIQPDRRYVPLYSLPVTGTAVGQPLGESGNEPADENGQAAYARKAKGKAGGGGEDFDTMSSVTHAVEQPDQPIAIAPGFYSGAIQKQAKVSLGKLAKLSNLYESTKDVGEQLGREYSKSNERTWGLATPESEREKYRSLQLDDLAASGRNSWEMYVPPSLDDHAGLVKSRTKTAAPTAGLEETSAQEEAFSTFSLHVSDVSFKLARAALAKGQWPEAAKVRIEEFVNAFDYGDPMPTRNERISCQLEQAIHPFLQQRNLLRISMRTAAAGRSSNTPLRLTFVLDNSGSMERIDRQQTVRRAFALLARQLKPIDQVTLISFARQPRLLADKVSGDQAMQLIPLIDNLPSEGGTNIEAALQLGFEKAREHYADGAQNRVILLTDGAVNLGDANPERLSQMIVTMRNAGFAFDAAGICAEGLNDEVLEALTRKGDGRYYLLDSVEAADDGFARQIAGALRPSAKNVKVQVEFNPKRVGLYKLLGFEKHRLNQEDFRNDSVDAAEMAAAEAGVAMYQFEAKPDGEGDVGSVSVRFRDLSTGQMVENRWPIPYETAAGRIEQTAPSLRIAASAALLAAKLRGEPLGETVDLKALSDLIAGLPQQDRNAERVQQLHQMIQQARQLAGE